MKILNCYKSDHFWKFRHNVKLLKHWSPALGFPGNPGVVGYYRIFMQTIHSMCDYKHPVWAVSHAGHCVTPDSMDMVEGKLLFMFIEVKLPFFLKQFIKIEIIEELQLLLIVICYFFLYKVGILTVWKCNPPNTRVHNSNCFHQNICDFKSFTFFSPQKILHFPIIGGLLYKIPLAKTSHESYDLIKQLTQQAWPTNLGA